MTDLAIITPTRGRPERFRDLVLAVEATAAGPVHVWAGVDDDDPALDEYERQFNAFRGTPGNKLTAARGSRHSLCEWTNALAFTALGQPDPPRYLASLGDDHRPRTHGWDRMLIEAIEQMDGPGFAYGRDLFQDKAMPTAWVASAEVVRSLGWMMLPTCAHMYVDAAILALGLDAGRIAYRPDVVIEHLHPLAGKAVWDPSYRESNSSGRYDADRAAFEAWHVNGRAADAAKLGSLVYEGVHDA